MKRVGQALIVLGALTVGHAFFPVVKGALAMQLIQSRYVAAKPAQRPWPGADFALSAKLVVPSLAVQQIVLSNASPRTLAFGPGFAITPNHQQGGVISAHRDSHFAWVKSLTIGTVIDLQIAGHRSQHYLVIGSEVIDSATHRLSKPPAHMLLLTTCYPFDAISAGGSLRYVVELKRVDTIGTELERQTLVRREQYVFGRRG